MLRPWGEIDWLLGKLGNLNWSLLGCAGTEERSLSLALQMGRDAFGSALMLAIKDPEPLDMALLEARLSERREQLRNGGFADAEIVDTKLIEDLGRIRRYIDDFAVNCGENLIFDITSMPKIWFFPIIQMLMSIQELRNIIVTYTSCAAYSDYLSGNSGPLRALPGFYADDGRETHDNVIVGIGFEPLGLLPLLNKQASGRIRLIFPFPPGPPAHRKNWMFVKEIEQLTSEQSIEPPDRVHIHMYDVPQVFDALSEMTQNANATSAIAPYGPKTVSLSMCLFSIAAAASGRQRVPVYYAQPLRYNLDYSTGVRIRNGKPDTKGYCIRLSGRDLYTLS